MKKFAVVDAIITLVVIASSAVIVWALAEMRKSQSMPVPVPDRSATEPLLGVVTPKVRN